MFGIKRPSLYRVFTPTTPATLTYVERKSVATKIQEVLTTPGKQLVLFGHSGCGKTTLLTNMLGSEHSKIITTRCTSSTTFDQLLLSAFDELGPFVITRRKKSEAVSLSASLTASYSAIRASLSSGITSSESAEESRVLPPQLTAQNLANFLGEAGCCWVLEDFNKINKAEKSQVSQIFKMFMDSAAKHEQLMIIAVGAVDSAREVIEYDPDMRNRVAEVFVPLMSDDEIREIVYKGTSYLNISFSDELIELLTKYSNGLASICHQLCLNICFHNKIMRRSFRRKVFKADSIEPAVIRIMESASDTLKRAFDTALKMDKTQYQNDAELILRELVQFHFHEGVTYSDLFDSVRQIKEKYPERTFNSFLEDLQIEKRGQIVRYNSSIGKYYFENPFYYAYAMALFTKERPKKYDAPEWPTDLDALFNAQVLGDFDEQVNTISDAWVRFIYFEDYSKSTAQRDLLPYKKHQQQMRWTVKAPPPPKQIRTHRKR